MSTVEVRHFHLFAGLGGGARGFNRGESRVGQMQARFRCIGGIDVDPAAMRDFQRLAGVPGTVLDMFDREQFVAFHGREPGPCWREATPQDIQSAAGGERPHIVFLSAPCKGFSGLLSETKSKTAKYQALNRLTLRGVWLMLEAWADDPTELVLFENVPRLATRGRALLDRITAMLRAASRITLVVAGVRIERLQDISEADARAEGARCADEVTGREVLFPEASKAGSYRLHYRDIWEQINGPGSWDANPWVWVVEFERLPA